MTAESPVAVGLVHGLGATPGMWEGLAAALPGWTRTAAPALPWGRAPEPGWAARRDVGGWVTEAFGGEVPPVLVAHSFGANAVLEHVCTTRPAGLRALVLCAPYFVAPGREPTWADLDRWAAEFAGLLAQGLLALGTRAGPERLAGMAAKVRDRIGPHAWTRFLDLFLGTASLPLGAIDVPVLVLSGARDPSALPAYGRALAAALPRGEYAELDAGHFLVLDRPGPTAELVTAFLTRHVGPVGAAA